jgi:hypothetical protein
MYENHSCCSHAHLYTRANMRTFTLCPNVHNKLHTSPKSDKNRNCDQGTCKPSGLRGALTKRMSTVVHMRLGDESRDLHDRGTFFCRPVRCTGSWKLPSFRTYSTCHVTADHACCTLHQAHLYVVRAATHKLQHMSCNT